MVDFSIKALTAPCVPPVQEYFKKTTTFIIKKYPELKLDFDKVDHDLKVVMFNAATALLVSTLAMAYFKTIALVTAVALTVLFYLVRRIVQESIFPPKPPSETTITLQDVVQKGLSLLPARRLPAPSPPHKSIRERVKETFYHGDDIGWGPLVILKTTYYPMPIVIRIFLTRSP
jgi:hypothetical protein